MASESNDWWHRGTETFSFPLTSWGGQDLSILGLRVLLAPWRVPGVSHPSSWSLSSASGQPVLRCSSPYLPWCLLQLLALVQNSAGLQSSTVVIFWISTAWDPNLHFGLFARGFLEAPFWKKLIQTLWYIFWIYTCVTNDWSCLLSFKRIQAPFAMWVVQLISPLWGPPATGRPFVQPMSEVTVDWTCLMRGPRAGNFTSFLMTLAVLSGSDSGDGPLSPCPARPPRRVQALSRDSPSSHWPSFCRCNQAGLGRKHYILISCLCGLPLL